LVLTAALALGALAMGARGAVDREAGLGEAVAHRISCAARDLCRGAGSGAGPPGVAERTGAAERPGAGLRAPSGAGPLAAPRGARPFAAPRGAVAAPRRGRRPGALEPRARPSRERSPAGSRRASSREADAFQRLRGVGGVARYAWIACLGYRGWHYELTHPRPPSQAMSFKEALDIANTCLNPLAFLLP
jgi:hypothetical protein